MKHGRAFRSIHVIIFFSVFHDFMTIDIYTILQTIVYLEIIYYNFDLKPTFIFSKPAQNIYEKESKMVKKIH